MIKARGALVSNKRYRIVWNDVLGETLASGITTDVDIRLNNDAGQLLYVFSQGNITYDDLQKQYGDFFEKCKKLEFIKNESPNFAISHISSKYPLKRLQIELSLLCNLSCSYCYSTSGPNRKSRLTQEKVIEFIDDAYDLGCLWIDFTGGEPLAYKGWEEVVGYAMKKGLVCSLHTNGVLLDDRNIQKISDLGIRHIQTSLDSHLSEIHDKMRGKEGAFEKTVSGIKRCRALGIPVKVSIVAHKYNRDHFAEAVRFFREDLGVRVLIDRIIRAGGEISADVGLTTKEYFDLIRPIIRDGVAESRVCDNFVVNDFKVEPHCGVAHSFIYITADGEFALCPTMTARDNPTLFNSPRMDVYNLKEAWLNSEYFNSYRGLNCRNTSKCPTASTCGGGCRSNAYLETGELDSPDFMSCNVFKNFTEQFIDFKTLYKSKETAKNINARILP